MPDIYKYHIPNWWSGLKWGKNTNGNNPLRIVPIHFRVTRGFSLVPDYGYYDWLFDPAFRRFRSALNFSILPVTAKSSGCPPDRFFRFDLHGRSYQVSHLKPVFRPAIRWKVLDYPKIIFHLGQFSGTEVPSNLSPSWINVTMNFWR